MSLFSNQSARVGQQVRIKWTEPQTVFCGQVGFIEATDSLDDGEWFYVRIHQQPVAFRAHELEILP